ncbi:hypothetical protein ACWCXX_34170 [Streptomyces sp. NPDC001732]
MGAATAELSKLRTLPVAVSAVLGTIGIGAAIGAALARMASADTAIPDTAIALKVVPYVQIGAILLGILPVAHEYEGRQICTTLASVPDRGRVIAAKSIACGTVLAVTLLATIASVLGTVSLIRWTGGGIPAATPQEWERTAGAVLYLVLIGLLAHAATLVLRHLVPALITMLVLVLVLPPVLAGLGEHARWLPDRAGTQLYAPADMVLTPGTGALVLLGWVLVVGAPGAIRFLRADT